MTEETESQAPTAPSEEEEDRDDKLLEQVIKEFVLVGKSQQLAGSVFTQTWPAAKALASADSYRRLIRSADLEFDQLIEEAQAAIEAQKALELSQLKRQVGVLQNRVAILEEAAQAPLEAPPSKLDTYVEMVFNEFLRRMAKGTVARFLPEAGDEERSQEFEPFERRLTELASVEDGWLQQNGSVSGLAPDSEALECLRTATLRGQYPIPSVFAEIDGTVTAQWRSGRRVARIEFRPDGVLTGRTIPKADYALRTNWKTSPRLPHKIASFLNEVDIP